METKGEAELGYGEQSRDRNHQQAQQRIDKRRGPDLPLESNLIAETEGLLQTVSHKDDKTQVREAQ